MLAFLLKDREIAHTPELERKILTACLEAGGWEMRYCSSRFIVEYSRVFGVSALAVVRELPRRPRVVQ